MTMEVLKNAEFIIGLIVTLFGVVSGLIIWLDKRQKDTAKNVFREASGKSDVLAVKVNEIEEDVGAVAHDVTELKSELAAQSKRIQGVERSMETVARQSDLSDLKTQVAHMEGSVMSSIKQLSSIMHSFQVSALRAAEKREH